MLDAILSYRPSDINNSIKVKVDLYLYLISFTPKLLNHNFLELIWPWILIHSISCKQIGPKGLLILYLGMYFYKWLKAKNQRWIYQKKKKKAHQKTSHLMEPNEGKLRNEFATIALLIQYVGKSRSDQHPSRLT